RCVRLLGEQDDDTLLRYYRESNLFLSPSVFETFGMAIQEALMFGMPALVHAGGNSANHIREGLNGHVVHSHREMARLLSRLIDAPGELAQLHQNMRTVPSNYLDSWQAAADLLCRFVETI
ncbi:MAG: glycosyltransferase, partial [Saprospiraceae bacterium]|nr:glycosyltransferase [Saprospiraceae bacterium]